MVTRSGAPMSRRETIAVAFVAATTIAGVWSYLTGGIVHAVIAASLDGDRAITSIRDAVERAGPFAPFVYVAAVVVEVIVAPIPGTLLYAPGGAIFGGFLGGTLSLAGNVIGAGIAAWLASTFGARIAGRSSQADLSGFVGKVRERGLLVITLLRINPLTSSDLVSYAAGLVGIPVWRVAMGTLMGMAPLCYAQAYASEWIWRTIPGSGLLFLILGVGYLVVVLWWLIGSRAPRHHHET